MANPSPSILSIESPEFSHVQRMLNKRTNQYVFRILPGEYYFTTKDEVISTTLGSCISACVRDTELNIGGMNHFMLPNQGNSSSWEDLETRYGNVAMERLINSIFKAGGRRENLEIKVFGGGKIVPAMSDVGDKNISFIKEYLSTEGYEIASEDLGLEFPRKVNYFPKTGRVMMKRLRSIHKKSIAQEETKYVNNFASNKMQDSKAGDVELF
ncbi:MAG: chemoreceptor glutamine deamidase CheD [Gammaproteobacteria bacterium]